MHHISRKVITFHGLDVTFYVFYLTQLVINVLRIAGVCLLQIFLPRPCVFDQQNSVIKIVREKYLNTTAFTDKQKLQAFLSELYVFLIDQMHVALNKVICYRFLLLLSLYHTDFKLL